MPWRWNSHAGGRSTHLIYVFWEPHKAADHPEVIRHREETAELVARVAGGCPAFHAVSYEALFAEWSVLRPEASWRTVHVAQLRAQYGGIVIERR